MRHATVVRFTVDWSTRSLTQDGGGPAEQRARKLRWAWLGCSSGSAVAVQDQHPTLGDKASLFNTVQGSGSGAIKNVVTWTWSQGQSPREPSCSAVSAYHRRRRPAPHTLPTTNFERPRIARGRRANAVVDCEAY